MEWRPPQITGIWLEGVEDALRAPLPGLLMIRKSLPNKVDYRVFACKERPVAINAALFRAPLPNVGDGGVCWGTVTKVSKAALAGNDLKEDWQHLLGSPFTGHNVDGKSRKYKKDIRLALTGLVGCESYPLEDLVDAKRTLAEEF